MNKTTTVNIGGLVFNIDLDAYERLNKYLRDVSGYFSDSESRKEILSDIESRMAELFQERLKSSLQVLNLTLVEEVIKIMGEPEEFAQEEKMDTGSSKDQGNKGRSIFRDPDNKVLAGVCGGIGHYIGVDPVWIRLFFIVAFLGWGSGIILYLILYAIIPEAKTTAEKLEMKGEPVNVDNIGKTIEKELKDVQDRLNEFSKRGAGSSLKGFINAVMGLLEKLLRFLALVFEKVIDFLGKAITVLVNTLGRLIGIGFIAFGTFLLVLMMAILFNSSLLISITSDGLYLFSLKDFFTFFSTSEQHWNILLASIILFLGVPIVAFVFGGFKLLFPGYNSLRVKNLGLLFFGLWIIGLALSIYLTFQIGMQFKNRTRVIEETTMPAISSSNLHVDLNPEFFEEDFSESEDVRHSFTYSYQGERIKLVRLGRLLFQENGQQPFLGIPKVVVSKTEGNNIRLKLYKYSNGVSLREAEELAKGIQYNFQIDSINLMLNPAYEVIGEKKLFRNQSVRIELLIPENTIISLSPAVEKLLISNRGFWNHDSGRWKDKSTSNSVTNEWIMTDQGFICLTCDEELPEGLDSIKLKINVEE